VLTGSVVELSKAADLGCHKVLDYSIISFLAKRSAPVKFTQHIFTCVHLFLFMNKRPSCMEEHIKTTVTNWNDLKYFIYLAKHQRLNRVAKILETSHVTVSNRITTLEDCLKIKLFTRQANGYILTKEGEILLHHAQKMEQSLLNGIRESCKALNSRAHVRIGVTEGLGNYYLAERLGRLAKKEGIDMDFIALPKITSVTEKTVDISISLEYPTSEHVIKKELTTYTLGIFASKEYIEKNKPIKSSNLIDHKWVGYIENLLFTDELRYHDEISKKLDYSFRSTSIMAQVEAAKQGLGLAILPLYIAKNTTELINVSEDLTFKRKYWITSNSDLHRFKSAKIVWNYILECCNADSTIFN
jgi:DNA-binding transcriptional LysR family regulator